MNRGRSFGAAHDRARCAAVVGLFAVANPNLQPAWVRPLSDAGIRGSFAPRVAWLRGDAPHLVLECAIDGVQELSGVA